MAQLERYGEIPCFDPEQWNAGASREGGRLLVATLRPPETTVLSPDIGSFGVVSVRVEEAEGQHVSQYHLDHEQMGLMFGHSDPRLAAARLMQRVAADEGVPAGHGFGLTDAQGFIEVLASPPAKEAIRRRASEVAGNIGCFLVVDASYFNERSVFDTPASRGKMPIEAVLGVTPADLEQLTGSQGLDGLRSQSEHPIVRAQLEALGLPFYGSGSE